MIDDICKAGLCGPTKLPDLTLICGEKYNDLPMAVQRKSSFPQICSMIDYNKICYNKEIAPKLCPDGKSIERSWC